MATENNKGILSLNIKGKSALYVSYMPFVHNGGMFIPNKKSDDYSLGDDIFVLLSVAIVCIYTSISLFNLKPSKNNTIELYNIIFC